MEAEQEKRIQMLSEYRARKWCRRTPWMFAAAAIMVFVAFQPWIRLPHELVALLGFGALGLTLIAINTGVFSAAKLSDDPRFRYERTIGCTSALIALFLLGIPVVVGFMVIIFDSLHYKSDKGREEMWSLRMGVTSFAIDYGLLPVPGPGGGGADSRAIVQVLIANEPVANPRNTVFLELETADVDGTFLDPWGTQYTILLDDDGDGKVVHAGKTHAASCVVVSAGKDRLFGTKDDLLQPP